MFYVQETSKTKPYHGMKYKGRKIYYLNSKKSKGYNINNQSNLLNKTERKTTIH